MFDYLQQKLCLWRSDPNNCVVVLATGCFDLLHLGHAYLLARAVDEGDKVAQVLGRQRVYLVVGVNDDASVRLLKGPSRPVCSLEERIAMLEALRVVDAVVPFSEPDPIALIRAVRPDVFVKGGDYLAAELPETPVVESLGGRVVIVPRLPEYSTTALVERLREVRGE